MRPRTAANLVTFTLLGLSAGVSFLLPDSLNINSARAQSGPEIVRVTGTIRDFHRTNANFNVAPSGGNGHYAGNVNLTLGSNDRPTYKGTGFKVTGQWKDMSGNPIAPHMYLDAADARQVRLVNGPTITNNPTIDTFDSTAGAYGGGNVGPAPTFVSGSTVPAVSEPTGMPALISEYLRDGNATTVINSDINCNRFLIRNSHCVRFSGTRRLLVHEEFMIENFSKIELLAGASLTIWVKKDATIKNNIEFNLNTADPSRLVIYNLGINNFTIENSAATYVQMVAPNGGLHVKNSGQFCGTYTGKNMTIDNGCGIHIDTGGYGIVCGVEAEDDLGAAGAASNGGLVSSARFTEWYVDAMGVNASMHHTIELVRASDGVFEYLDDEFYPIDGLLFGNEGQAHNNYFTFAIGVDFVHHACDGRFFQFQGCDDAWLFINGQLALDIGGVIPGTPQYIEIDRMNLTDGETYALHFFYAQRNPTMSVFRMRTNLDLEVTPAVCVVSGGWD